MAVGSEEAVEEHMESGAVAVLGSGNDGGERVEAFFSGKMAR
jgi:hypothetical protein